MTQGEVSYLEFEQPEILELLEAPETTGRFDVDPSELATNGLAEVIELNPQQAESDGIDHLEISADLTPDQVAMLKQFFPMAVAYARNAFNRNQSSASYADYEEMRGDAFLGLAKAVIRFNPDKSNEKATTNSDFFTRCIKGEISRGMRDRYGRSYDGVDPHTNLPTKDGTARVKPSVLFNNSKALDQPVATDEPGGATVGSLMPAYETSEDTVAYATLKADIDRVVSNFSERDQKIFNMFIYDDMSQQAIAKTIGLSQMSISRIVARMTDHVRIQLAA